MNDFMVWIENEYGDIIATLFLMALISTLVATLVVAIYATSGAALLLVPAFVVYIVVRYFMKRNKS